MVVDYDADGYRLPTDEEWLWAAIGANKTGPVNETGYSKYYSGGFPDGIQGGEYYQWILSNAGEVTHEVGGLFPNELGIYDMSGNVSELTHSGKKNLRACGTTFVHPVDYQIFWYAMVSGETNSSNKSPYTGLRVISNQ
jgi:formylglycine-generating enzyme required for sulfatase activity